MAQTEFFTTLENRGLVTVSGESRHDFLQNLITNDIKLLEQTPQIYACLLTPQGKFSFDFFVTQDENTIYLDCEGGHRNEELADVLRKYVLRSDLEIHNEPEKDVYAIFGANHGHPDPRHPQMGNRSFEKPEGLEEEPFSAWDERRIRLTIPDGSRDLISGQSTMDEAHMDKLNAIDYEKGCYIGQELTARMHYRGLGKKHLYTVEFDGKTFYRGQEVVALGKPLGEMRSICGHIAIALLKDSELDKLPKAGLILINQIAA